MPVALTTPSLLVGVGRFGSRVAQRLAIEAAELHRGALGDAPDTDTWAEAVRVGGLDLVLGGGARPEELALRAAEAAAGLLSHVSLSRSRDAPGRDGPTRLHVLVIGHLAESEVRRELAALLRALEAELLRRFGPIFQAHRVGVHRNLVILPLLATPHPAAHPEGDDVLETLRALEASIRGVPSRDRAVPQAYVIEDVAELSVLSEREQEQSIRNFATLLLHDLGSLDRGDDVLYGSDPKSPLASFACAVAELPRQKLRRYALGAVALEVLEAVADTPEQDPALEHLDVLEDVDLAALDVADETEGEIEAVLDRYAPLPTRDPEPRWWTRSETLRARYGPDHGDAASAAAFPPAEPPVGWALERMREIEAGWRKLQRRRFDDLIERERRSIESQRDRIRAQAQGLVDTTLWSDPSPVAFRRAATLSAKLERHLSERLEEAVRARNDIEPPPAPRFGAFRAAHAAFLDACRRKPDLGRMLLFGVLASAATGTLGPTCLDALAHAIGAGPGDWYEPWLRARSLFTSLAIGALVALTVLGSIFSARVADVREAYHDMWNALEATVRGAPGSVLDYFASRLRLARQVARVEALLAVHASAKADGDRLALLDRAVRRARAELLDEQRRLGVARRPSGDVELAGLVTSRDAAGVDEALIEPLVGPAGLRALVTTLAPEEREARVTDVLTAIAETSVESWRDDVPFTDLERLRAHCAGHARPVGAWSPFEETSAEDDAAARIAEFVRRQARSLGVALRYRGTAGRGADVLRGVAIVPRACVEAVRRHLAGESAAGRAAIPVLPGDQPDRAYYVLVTTDIALEPSSSGTPEVPDAFDVERGAR